VLALAIAAAIAASSGDLLMLWVGNSLRPELGLARPPAFALPVGGALGVVAIRMYGLGYAAVARASGARVVFLCGAAGALIGAAIHGLTWLAIRAGLESGAAAAPPLEAVAGSGALVALWALAAALVVIASATLAASRALPRTVRWLNPAAVTLAFVAMGMPSEWGRSFLAPAAPNLAHVVFFVAAWRRA